MTEGRIIIYSIEVLRKVSVLEGFFSKLALAIPYLKTIAIVLGLTCVL